MEPGLTFQENLMNKVRYKYREFKVTHQARRHSRSLVCFGCGRGHTDGWTDTITKTNEPPMPLWPGGSKSNTSYLITSLLILHTNTTKEHFLAYVKLQVGVYVKIYL